MKTRIWISSFILAFSLSSFTIIPPSQEKKVNILSENLLPANYCAIYAISSVTRNIETPGTNYDGYLLYFCSDYTFSVYTDTEVYNGTWYGKGGTLVISVSAPPDIEWINGTWQVIQETEDILEIERGDKGDYFRVLLEKRQR